MEWWNLSTNNAPGEEKSKVEIGTEFELQVQAILEANGYQTEHNVTLVGLSSGAPHQIDVLAKHKGPMHDDVIIVECKAYTHNVEKDVLMKQLNIREDLKFGHVMIATTADFTSGCYQTAAPYKYVTLLNGKKIENFAKGVSVKTTMKPLFVKPAVTKSKARNYAKSKAKKMSGGIFHHRPKVSIKSITLVCYPFYNIKYHHEKMEKKGFLRKYELLRKIPFDVSVDARLGMVVAAGKGLSYSLAFVKNLDLEDVKLLQSANKKMIIGKPEIIKSGVAQSDADERLKLMHGHGFVKRMNMKGKIHYKANRTVHAPCKASQRHTPTA